MDEKIFHEHAYRIVTKRGKSLKLPRTPSPLIKSSSKRNSTSTRKQPKYTKINIYKENHTNPIFTKQTREAIQNIQKLHRENVPDKFYKFLQKVIYNEKKAEKRHISANNFAKLFSQANK